MQNLKFRPIIIVCLNLDFDAGKTYIRQVCYERVEELMSDEHGLVVKKCQLPAVINDNSLTAYLEKIKNPYCFRCGDAVVSIHFADKGNSLDSLLKNYFLGLKRS